MHFAVVSAPEGSQGKPYRFFKFRTLNAANKCPDVDEFALVYESEEQLQQLCHADDLKGILRSLGVEIPSNATPVMLARALHRLVEENATTWSSEKAEEITQSEEPEMAEKKAKKPAAKKPAKPKAEKVAKPKAEKRPVQAKVSGKLPKESRIKVVGKNPARPGSIRFENLEVIFAAKTVEEALRNLRAMPRKGGMIDIRFAIDNGLIEVANG
jgi:hypothetical protein